MSKNIQKKIIDNYEELLKETYEMDYIAIYDDCKIIKKKEIIVIDGYVIPGIHRKHINYKEGNMHCYNKRPTIPVLDSMNIKLLVIEVFIENGDASIKMYYIKYEE